MAREIMSEKLQQAISSIKAGNKQLGQQLLDQLLQEEPDNELGWLWMSAVVSEDKRRYCIEQVLKINPNNKQAMQGLENLKQTEKISQQSSMSSPTTLKHSQQSESLKSETETNDKSETQSVKPKLWINQGSKTTHIMALLDKKLIAAKCAAGLTAQVYIKLTAGNLPTELLTELAVVSYENILSVEESVNSINIEFTGKNNKKENVRFECKDKEMGKVIMQELEEWLKPDFISATTPMSKGSILYGNGAFASIILIITAFFYFAAKDVQTYGVSQIGSGKTKLLAILLSWIGPGGIVCIGGGILLTVLVVMVSSLINPPLETTLSRKTSNKA